MAIVTVVVSALLAPAFIVLGGLKVAGAKQSLQIRDQLLITAGLWVLIGALELAGAAGLLIGLWVPAIGIAAAVGLGLLMAGASVRTCAPVTHATSAPPRSFLYWPPRSRSSRSDRSDTVSVPSSRRPDLPTDEAPRESALRSRRRLIAGHMTRIVDVLPLLSAVSSIRIWIG